MVVTSTENNNTERRSRKGLWAFLAGLLIGLLLGGTVLASMLNNKDEDKSSQSSNNAASSQNANSDSDASSSSSTLNSTGQAAVARYAQMLVEASREGVDAPSDEATAAQASLKTASDGFATSIVDAKLLNSSANKDEFTTALTAVNTSFMEYAATARQGDDHTAVDAAVKKLSNYLNQNAKFKNAAQADALMTSFKNTVLESIRDFVNNDYEGSYTKETQAQTDLKKVVDNLKQQ